MHFPFIDVAQAAELVPITTTENGTGILVGIGNNLFGILMFLAGIIAVFYVVYSGWLYISSAGNPEIAKKARATLVQAVVGLIIVISAFAIVRLAGRVSKEINCAQEKGLARILCRVR